MPAREHQLDAGLAEVDEQQDRDGGTEWNAEQEWHRENDLEDSTVGPQRPQSHPARSLEAAEPRGNTRADLKQDPRFPASLTGAEQADGDDKSPSGCPGKVHHREKRDETGSPDGVAARHTLPFRPVASVSTVPTSPSILSSARSSARVLP